MGSLIMSTCKQETSGASSSMVTWWPWSSRDVSPLRNFSAMTSMGKKCSRDWARKHSGHWHERSGCCLAGWDLRRASTEWTIVTNSDRFIFALRNKFRERKDTNQRITERKGPHGLAGTRKDDANCGGVAMAFDQRSLATLAFKCDSVPPINRGKIQMENILQKAHHNTRKET